MTRLQDIPTPWGLETAQFRKILVGAFIGLVLFLLPAPAEVAPDLDLDGIPDYPTLHKDAKNALALFVVIIYFWATEALPLPVTALGAGVGLVLLGIVDTPNDAWGPYAQDTIFFLLGSLIIADAITKTHADRVLAGRFLGKIGHSTDTLLFGIVAVSAIAAMFVSNHAVAAVMLPLVIGILRSTGLLRDRAISGAFILAIAFGATIAGLGTPSGGSRNIIVMGFLSSEYGVDISYLDWTIRAAPITLVLIPVVYIILKLMFKLKNRPIEREMDLEDQALNSEQRRALWIMGITVVLWITVGTEIGLGTIAVMGAIMLFVTGILDWVDTRKRIAWGVPLIYGAALAMGDALIRTGAVKWLSASLTELPIWGSGTTLFVGSLIMAIILTNIMSDGGTAAVLAPVTLALAASLGQNIGEVGMVTAIGAAYGFLFVVANPGNVITYQSGLFTSRDLMRAGVPLTLVSIVVTYIAITLYWPWLGPL